MSDVAPDRSGHLQAGEHRVWWEYFGKGEREAVVLLNGLAMHTKAWYSFLPELHPEFDVLLYDYLGQGDSSCPDVPYFIPDFADHLAAIMDELGVGKIHVMGISYGGFIALDFGRLHAGRILSMTVSGILLSRERLFEMYQEISLRFYRGGPEAFEIYTHYLYEKIFGEPFVRKIDPELMEQMRQRFHERYKDRIHSLVRLTEAQDPFFDGLDERMEAYRAVDVPILILAGEQDRAIPVWQQRKLCDIFPDTRMEIVPATGHVVYLEKQAFFFETLRRFMRVKSLEFDLP